jgi:predicted RNase H-like HicB family nuclease
MRFDYYKVVLYRQDDGSWVAEIPAVGGFYALMDTRDAALAELEPVFAMIAQERAERGVALAKDLQDPSSVGCLTGGVQPAAMTRRPQGPWR